MVGWVKGGLLDFSYCIAREIGICIFITVPGPTSFSDRCISSINTCLVVDLVLLKDICSASYCLAREVI